MGKNTARHKARKHAFQVLYGLSFTPVADLQALRKAFEFPPDNGDNSDWNADFAWDLVQGVWSQERELDSAINRFSHKWRVDRLGRIELTILRLALLEILSCITPPKVVINEALDLARDFGAVDAKNLINGILDAASKSNPPGSQPDAWKAGAMDGES